MVSIKLTSIITFLVASNAFARIELPLFESKLALENIRFMTKDGRFTYTQKRSGALSLNSSFKSVDIIESAPGTNYYITSSAARKKMVVEIERNWHQELDLTKLHEIRVGTFASTQFSFVGKGRNPRLHLDDDWLTWFDPKDKSIHVQFLRAKDPHHIIRLGKKLNAFFTPEVVMINPETVLYTDINDKGYAALLAWNLVTKKLTVIRKAEVTGTRMELCRRGNYVALGEFSYDDTNRGSGIQILAWKDTPNLAGFTSIYRVSDNDLGQMVCDENKVWFIKTMSEDRKLNIRQTDVVVMDITSGQLVMKSEMERVTNIVEMDGRILVPFRDSIYVASGSSGSKSDALKAPPSTKSGAKAP